MLSQGPLCDARVAHVTGDKAACDLAWRTRPLLFLSTPPPSSVDDVERQPLYSHG